MHAWSSPASTPTPIGRSPAWTSPQRKPASHVTVGDRWTFVLYAGDTHGSVSVTAGSRLRGGRCPGSWAGHLDRRV